jgi:hypothetical protein
VGKPSYKVGEASKPLGTWKGKVSNDQSYLPNLVNIHGLRVNILKLELALYSKISIMNYFHFIRIRVKVTYYYGYFQE